MINKLIGLNYFLTLVLYAKYGLFLNCLPLELCMNNLFIFTFVNVCLVLLIKNKENIKTIVS